MVCPEKSALYKPVATRRKIDFTVPPGNYIQKNII
jgi:hypothetical protein